MLDLASETDVSALTTGLWSVVRALTDEREVDADLRMLGKPEATSAPVRRLLVQMVTLVVESARGARELHHVALEVSFAADAVSIRIEHDGTLDNEQRLEAERALLARYNEIGGLGGTLAFSSGRGYGLRVEVSAPYDPASASMLASGEAPPARMSPASPTPPILTEPLTPREATTLNLLAVGLSNKEIAGRMHLGVGTVKFHLAQIYQKLGVQGRGRVAAVARARELGLIFD